MLIGGVDGFSATRSLDRRHFAGIIMVLRQGGKCWYGDSQADIRIELARYGALRGYQPTEFADAHCKCGSVTFRLRSDENEGAAVRICATCGDEHAIGDSEKYLGAAKLLNHECLCGNDIFEISVGVSLYDDSVDVRWFYLGCRCPSCNLVGNYADWKNEFDDYHKLLERV